MGKYVVEVVGDEGQVRPMLVVGESGFSLTTQYRNATVFSTRKECIPVQEKLLSLSAGEMNALIRKPFDHRGHLSISIISHTNPDAKALNVRHKLYQY